jgi:hypothetical protein
MASIAPGKRRALGRCYRAVAHERMVHPGLPCELGEEGGSGSGGPTRLDMGMVEG